MEPWNNSTLEPPPINTVIRRFNIGIQDLLHVCSNIRLILLKQSPLHKECALLSRFVYKFDKKFRTDIGYRNLRKVHTAVRKYLSLNLLKDIETFLSILPKSNEDNFLPTKQMLEYILVRCISFSKIMMRVCICAKKSAIYYMDRVKRGQSHWMSLMPFALLSRIWSISVILLQQSCSWYSSLYPYLEKLEYKGMEFLPNGCLLPCHLEDQLDLKNVDNIGRFEWSHKHSIQINLDLVEDDNIDLDTILDYVKEVNKDCTIDDNQLNLLFDNREPPELFPNVTIKSDDQGQSISRQYFQTFFNNSNDNKITKKTHSAEDVTGKTSLELFITREETLRNNNSDESLTQHLSFMQWQTLKMALSKLSDPLFKNRKIQRKFQKIWQDKCLDYLQ